MVSRIVRLAPVAVLMLISAASIKAECGPGTVLKDGQCVVAPECGSGTVLKNGECVLDKAKLGAARMKTVDGGIEMSVGGAVLRLSAPVLPADQDENAKVYCQGEFVMVCVHARAAGGQALAHAIMRYFTIVFTYFHRCRLFWAIIHGLRPVPLELLGDLLVHIRF